MTSISCACRPGEGAKKPETREEDKALDAEGVTGSFLWGPALPCKISLARRHASIEKMQRAEMPSSRAVACRREDHIDAHLGG